MQSQASELLEGYKPRNILSIDLKCFYASVECIERGLDPFTTPLVVCDTSRGDDTIVLAVSPYLKTLGIPSRCRKYELPKNIPSMIYATPRMKLYLEKSVEVTNIYRNFVSKQDIHVYSIDESFLDVTDYLYAANMTDVEYAQTIIKEVKRKTGLTVCSGIGENLFLAKVAMDIGAKHKKSLFDKWTRKDLPSTLWPIKDLSKIWGIGSRMNEHLQQMGFQTMGDIAHSDPSILSKAFGIKGEELYLHANGIDRAIISQSVSKPPKSLSVGQVLFFDATTEEAIRIAREMGRKLANRIEEKKVAIGRLDLFLIASNNKGPSYSNRSRYEKQLDTTKEIEEEIIRLCSLCPSDLSIRSIYLVASELVKDNEVQMDFFTDWTQHDKERRLDKTIASIRQLYGNTSILRCSSLLKHSTEKARLSQIGGHRA